ncbi:hypothetical protein NSMS1_12440 [Nostoc sp. MS1]|nr:hypothetical protein NSMS1_12440 [Nostoc sp. MS1]
MLGHFSVPCSPFPIPLRAKYDVLTNISVAIIVKYDYLLPTKLDSKLLTNFFKFCIDKNTLSKKTGFITGVYK